jgi:glutaminase A
MQSISKPFVYGMALEDRGEEYVRRRVGVEPTGNSFNSMIEHEQVCAGRFNPMVNVGAVSTTSCIKGDCLERRLDRMMKMFAQYVGHPLGVDEAALGSRRTLDNLNRAIAYLMLSEGCIEGNVEETVELFANQCSVLVDCRDLAIMGATLANGGVHPFTGRRAVSTRHVRPILSTMFTSGMYDFAGEWAYNVGLPAKSGVSGCILGVVPGYMGIAVFSRPLDHHGNSTRGIKVFEELSRRLQLHIFQSYEQV